MKWLLLLIALPSALLAQALEGTWQGTLIPPDQDDGIRLVFTIEKNGNAWQGRFYNLANGRQFNLGAIALQGNAVKIAIPGNGMSYEGKIEADGNSIAGALIQGTNPRPLPLKRATPETAWELPPPPTAPWTAFAKAINIHPFPDLCCEDQREDHNRCEVPHQGIAQEIRVASQYFHSSDRVCQNIAEYVSG